MLINQIDSAIELIISGKIVDYIYNKEFHAETFEKMAEMSKSQTSS